MAEDRDRDIDDRHAGHAEDIAVAEKIPGGKVGKCGGDLVGIIDQQQIVGRAIDDQRDQGRDEGPEAEVTDQDAVDETERRARDHGGGGDRRNGPAENVQTIERAKIAQREHRADRQIDAADDDDQRHAEHDEADLAGLPRDVAQAADGKEARNSAAQRETDDEQYDDRDGRLGPALRQYLAEQMIGPEAISPAYQRFLHLRPCLDEFQSPTAPSLLGSGRT